MNEYWFELPFTSKVLVMCSANSKKEAIKELKNKEWDYDDECFDKKYDFDNVVDYKFTD